MRTKPTGAILSGSGTVFQPRLRLNSLLPWRKMETRTEHRHCSISSKNQTCKSRQVQSRLELPTLHLEPKLLLQPALVFVTPSLVSHDRRVASPVVGHLDVDTTALNYTRRRRATLSSLVPETSIMGRAGRSNVQVLEWATEVGKPIRG